MAKGQLESLGLVLIVLLLAVLLIFSLPFILKNDNQKEDDSLRLRADALRNVLLQTSLCPDANVKEEILNCEFDNPKCLDSCDKLGGKIEEMIGTILEPNIIYEFKVEGLNSVKSGDSSGCLNTFSSASQPLSENSKVFLTLCEK
ncbi:hypothetical protein HYT57_03765 [Candidatus Woesearchaeota archaeon]|nr:hypothetical protein [Candidatus Woesearchaeota archaeon]